MNQMESFGQLHLPSVERLLSESETADILKSDVPTLRWWRRKKMKSLNPILRGGKWCYVEYEVVQLAVARKKTPVVAGVVSLYLEE